MSLQTFRGSSITSTTQADCTPRSAISVRSSSRINTPGPWSKPQPDPVYPEGRTSAAGRKNSSCFDTASVVGGRARAEAEGDGSVKRLGSPWDQGNYRNSSAFSCTKQKLALCFSAMRTSADNDRCAGANAKKEEV